MNPRSRPRPPRRAGQGRGGEAEEDAAHKNVVTARSLIQTLAQARFRKESAAIKVQRVSARVRGCECVCIRRQRRQSSYSWNADEVLGPLTLLASSSSVLTVLHAGMGPAAARCQLAIFTRCNLRFNSVDYDPLEGCRWAAAARAADESDSRPAGGSTWGDSVKSRALTG